MGLLDVQLGHVAIEDGLSHVQLAVGRASCGLRLHVASDLASSCCRIARVEEV